MAAVPVGYQAFHSLPRKAVTLLCFLLASAMVMGISVYVDSYSVNEWNNLIDVGPIAITAHGEGIDNQVENIRGIPGVEKAAAIDYRHGELFVGGGYDLREWWGMLPSPTSDYLNTFPEVFNLEVGRFPSNASEITLARFTYEYLEVDIGSIVNLTTDWGEFGPVGAPLQLLAYTGVVTMIRVNPTTTTMIVFLALELCTLTLCGRNGKKSRFTLRLTGQG